MVLKLLNRLFDRYIPMPAVLAAALRNGSVRIAKTDKGEVAYFIAPHCPNTAAVKKAVDQRKTWELAATVVVSSVVVAAVVAVAQLIMH